MHISTSDEQFASDNWAGLCPEALEYLARANQGFVGAYGSDAWTQKAADTLRELFQTDCAVFFLATGTASNALALSALCRPYQSVICHEAAHIATSECGATEFFCGGSTLLPGKGDHGKLTPDSVTALAGLPSGVHRQAPGALSITQLTEFGTLYTVEELKALKATAERHDLGIHMDGARFANAVAALGVAPAELSWKVGVDVLCLGGSKNGGCIGEAVLFFDRELAAGFDYRCKQAGQLISKMRYVTAPWLGLLETGAWLANARHANSCATELEAALSRIEGVQVMYPCQGNSVFARFPRPLIRHLRRNWQFHDFFEEDVVRLMCSWNTTHERIARFVGDVEAGLALGLGEETDGGAEP
ncbi:MAG: L-threonine aldolase [Proteobacteria bacterium]|nr:L-threonine aldolase [Pseudomonadota bacterium]